MIADVAADKDSFLSISGINPVCQRVMQRHHTFIKCRLDILVPILPSVRKQHNAGYKHKANVRTYYQQFEEQQTQSLIDQRIKEHLGQTAAFQQQVGATYKKHLASF
ncbi:zinc finger protein [Cinnamomum micranthum f. kanehirae]|uniref:Zinc finger protein n=1 Tax=Cinnamomum micranthum f. kanehirae TaxID=337451 RepID=A0A3S3MXZ7_9MAGN|nr:zinc finger protein [Cinnamomum micranthum f. kanehirae]